MFDILVEIGILILLVYLPLDFGGVTPRALMILQIGSAGLGLIWLAKYSLEIQHGKARFPERNQPAGTHLSPWFWGALLLFFAVAFLQLMPLPAFIVKQLSPSAYRVYAEGALSIGADLPRFLPLSVCSQATEEELMTLLAYAAIFFLLLKTVRTRRQRKRFLYVILLIGFLESFYGLIQFFSGYNTIYTRQVSFWVHGSFVNKNHFAAYMEMIIPLVFGLFLARFETSFGDVQKPPEEKYIKAFFFSFVLVLMMGAHLLSGSKGGVVSLAAGMCCFFLLSSFRGLLRKRFMIGFLLLSLLIGMFAVLQTERILLRLESLTQLDSAKSFTTRKELWKNALHILQDYPLTGSGLGTFSHLFRRYRSFRSPVVFEYAENDYVQLLSESGVLGTGAFLPAMLFFLSWAITSWKRQRSKWNLLIASGGLSAMLSVLVHTMVDFHFHIPATVLLFIVIAVVCSADLRHPPSPSPTPSHQGRGTVDFIAQPVSLLKRGRRKLLLRVLIPALLLMLYIANAARTYAAYRHYQSASELLSDEKQDKSSPGSGQQELVMTHLYSAVRHDPNHARYFAALGNVLVEHVDYSEKPEGRMGREKNFSLAESLFQRAVMLDPANPWYYYGLGNLHYRRGDCTTGNWQDCPVTRYFARAFKNAPKNIFLRKTLGAWYYYFDRDVAYTFFEKIFEEDRRDPFGGQDRSRIFAEFLYEVGLDYESDREARFIEHNQAGLCELEVIETEASAGREVLELGSDDGFAEWRTVLRLESERVRKEICLPKNLADYHSASVKILMNRAGKGSLNVKLTLDDEQIEVAEEQLSHLPEWHEFPVDMKVLQGKSNIHVYLRASTSTPESSLFVWGDRDTPTSQSTLNFRQTHDLSSEKGAQRGEFMIRLVLSK